MPDPLEETVADRAYTWTVRLLYAGLIAGNLILIYDSWKDTPSGIEWRAKLRGLWTRARDCEGCARRREWINRQVGHVLWQATEIVEEAHAASGDQPRDDTSGEAR